MRRTVASVSLSIQLSCLMQASLRFSEPAPAGTRCGQPVVQESTPPMRRRPTRKTRPMWMASVHCPSAPSAHEQPGKNSYPSAGRIPRLLG